MNNEIESQGQFCTKHPGFKVQYLKVNDLQMNSNEKLLYCCACSDDDEVFQQKNFLVIQKIVQERTLQIISKWPPLNDNKILEDLINLKDVSHLIDEIDKFYGQFIKVVIDKIELSKKKLMRMVMEVSQDCDILQTYQEISRIEELKQTLLSQELDSQEMEIKCREIVEDLYNRKGKNSNLLKNILNMHQCIHEQVNFDRLSSIKQSVLQKLDQLSFFNSEKKKDTKLVIPGVSEEFLSQIQLDSTFLTKQNFESLQKIYQASSFLINKLQSEEELKQKQIPLNPSKQKYFNNSQQPQDFSLVQVCSYFHLNDEVIHYGNLIDKQRLSNIGLSNLYDLLGKSYENMRDTEEAIKSYQMQLRYQPMNTIPKLNLVRIFINQKKFDQSLPYIKQIIQADANNFEAYYYLGLVHLEKKQFNEAINNLNISLRINNQFLKSYLSLGYVYKELNQIDESIKNFLKVVEFQPNHYNGLYQLGHSYFIKNQFPESIQYFEKLVKLNQKCDSSLKWLGFLYDKIGQIDKSINNYIKSTEIKPDDDTFLKLGQQYEKIFNYEGAIIYYNKLLEIKFSQQIYDKIQYLLLKIQ